MTGRIRTAVCRVAKGLAALQMVYWGLKYRENYAIIESTKKHKRFSGQPEAEWGEIPRESVTVKPPREGKSDTLLSRLLAPAVTG